MLTIEEYISSRKKKDKLDEFDFQKHSENMGAVIKYVMEYFNTYLNLEDYSYEQVKTQQVIDRFKEGIIESFPSTHEYIIDYFWSTKKRLDKLLENTYKDIEDIDLFYLPEDDRKVAEHVCKKKLGINGTEDLLNNLATMSKEYRQSQTAPPRLSDMKEIDNAVSDWVIEVYKKHKVNLLDYASTISYEYHKRYIDTEYDRESETFYRINKYDYRYQDNPFNINDIYNRNIHREFIAGHKGELEMLIMYYWLFEAVHDQDYWPEYVKLSIENERVKYAKKKRILRPVLVQGLSYPIDINSTIRYIETKNGLLKEDPGQDYVLSITYEKSSDDVWKDKDVLDNLIKNLHQSFKQYGTPCLLEFLSPYAMSNSKEEFFERYQLFEKSMRRYDGMTIAVINGYTKKNKDRNYLFSTVDDMVCIRNTCKELKLQLKLSVDFTDTNSRNPIKKKMDDTINTFAGMRNFIIGIHINQIDSWGAIRHIYHNENRYEYVSAMDYPKMSTFMAGIATILQDSRTRYFIPTAVKDSQKLEILIDTLHRAGCCFENEETQNEA